MQHVEPPIVIRKYSNRRLYDTDRSRYVTLDELEKTVRRGRDVQVVDAKTGEDLTQPTLAQIILESRRASRLFPTNLLVQLIRMDDEALADFLGRWLSWALEIYGYGKQSAQAIAPFNPLATIPFAATNAIARLFTQPPPWSQPAAPPPPPPPATTAAPEPPTPNAGDIEELKQKIAALEAAMRPSDE